MSTPQQESSTIKVEKGKRGKRPGQLYFPRNSLKDSIRVPKVIWEKNGGNPMAILDIAKQLGYSPSSSTFGELLRSASRYGLTSGSWQQDFSKTISLTPNGESIVAATPADDLNSLKRSALEMSRPFQKLNETYNGKIIPTKELLINSLMRDFGLQKGDAEACYKVFIKNVEELLIYDDIHGKRYLRVDKLSSVSELAPQDTEMVEQEEEHDLDIQTTKELSVDEPEEWNAKVFVSHSKNPRILDQIKRMLKIGNLDYEVAEESKTTAIPIPEKIFGIMRNCNCAVINVSADEQEKQSDGNFGINQNVLIEIGAAFLAYDQRVILLVDKRLKLPSNLQGLYRSDYEGDELSWDTGMNLQEALSNFHKKQPAIEK